jgi:lytic murein transglycosylase
MRAFLKLFRVSGAAVSALSAAVVCVTLESNTATACGSGPGGFYSWLGQFRSKAASAGISAGTINAALSGVSYDSNVIRLDRGQHSFKLRFEQFYARRVDSGLIARGHRLMSTHRATLDRMEKRFGVPAEIVVSIWGLETAYGAQKGSQIPIVRSLATLAYDCRRSQFFEKELLAALKVIDRGDMSVSQMRGGWAGEIGQTQFLPSAYAKFAVDFDGDGRRDLVNSVPDVLASTANFLKNYGWQAGQPWGPGTANYSVIREWNSAEVYVKTISVMALQMAK